MDNKTIVTVPTIAPVSQRIVDALKSKYKADIAVLKANLGVYLLSPVGIGEHSDLAAEFDLFIGKIAELEGKLDALETIIDENRQVVGMQG